MPGQDIFLNIYKEFLTNLSEEISERIQNDQGVQALKQMEQKSYLLERVHQIVQNICSLRYEQTLKELMNKLHAQKRHIEHQQKQITQLTKQIQDISQLNLSSKQQRPNLEEKIQPLSKVQPTSEAERKKIDELEKQLICRQEQYKIRISELTSSLALLQQTHNKKISQYDQMQKGLAEQIKRWEEKYRNVYETKLVLESDLEKEIEKSLQKDIKIKQISLTLQTHDMTIQSQKKKSDELKIKLEDIENACNQLQKNNKKLSQKIINYQSQIQVLRSLNQQNIQSNEAQLSNRQDQLESDKLRQIEQQQKQQELKEKSRRLIELEKRLSKVTNQKNEAQLRLHEFKLQSEKYKLQQQSQINEVTLRYEKTIRKLKEQWNQEVREANAYVKDTELLKVKNKQAEYQRKINILQQQIDLKTEVESKLKRQMKQKEKTLHEKISVMQSFLDQSQSRELSLKEHLKQLEKRLSTKYQAAKEIDRQSIKKISICEEEISALKSQRTSLRETLKELQKQKAELNQKLTKYQERDIKLQGKQKSLQYERQDIQQYLKQISTLKEQKLLLQTQLRYLNKEQDLTKQALSDKKIQIEQLQEKMQRQRQSLFKAEKEVNGFKSELNNIKEKHQKQISELFKKHQIQLNQTKSSITCHFETLLRSREEKINQLRSSADSIEQQLILKTLKETIQQERQNNRRKEEKIEKLRQSEKKIKIQVSEISNKLNESNEEKKKLQKELSLSSQQNKRLVALFYHKNHENQVKFREFKHQFYLCLREVFEELRRQKKQIKEEILNLQKQFYQFLQSFGLKLQDRVDKLKYEQKERQNEIKNYYENEVIVRLEVEKQQIEYDYERKVKQKRIQFLTVLAEKQHQLKNINEKIDQYQMRNIQLEKVSAEIQSKNVQLSKSLKVLEQSYEKQNRDLFQLEKEKISLTHQVEDYKKQNTLYRQKLIKIESEYKEKLEKCREKYIQENQKLFLKYEKQFDKLIGMNVQSKQAGLSSMILTNIAPTKESQKVPKDSKLQQLKKQIYLQKKKLQTMQSTKSKIPTKGAKSTTNLMATKNKF